MRYSKSLFTVPLLFLLLFDLWVAFVVMDHGWPKYIATDDSGLVKAVRIPTTLVDLLAVFLLICLHVVLVYGTWRAWRLPYRARK